MQNTYKENYAICEYSDLDAVSMMRGLSYEMIESMLQTMGISINPELPREAYIPAFLDEFTNNGDWILKILPSEAIDLLLDIWDQMDMNQRKEDLPPAVWMEEEEWDNLQFLRLFGLLTYKKGNLIANEPNIIYIVKEMKDAFYFHLRSKNSQKLMEDYDMWEMVIRGLMCYYGIVDINRLYEKFVEVLPDSSLSQEEFLIFLRMRIMMWNFGSFLRDVNQNTDYYMLYEVENPNQVLKKRQKHPDISYKRISLDDLIYVSEAAGLDNRWEGITTVATFLIDKMNMTYFRATIFIRSILSMIQNGYHLSKLQENVLTVTAGSGFTSEELEQGIEEMYYNIPVFELKGHTRREYDSMRQIWKDEKRKQIFKIIKGGNR